MPASAVAYFCSMPACLQRVCINPTTFVSCSQLKPMNCPFHISIYKQGYYSYRDLPIRWAELGTGEPSIICAVQ